MNVFHRDCCTFTDWNAPIEFNEEVLRAWSFKDASHHPRSPAQEVNVPPEPRPCRVRPDSADVKRGSQRDAVVNTAEDCTWALPPS
jgi:hypothetical protein